MAAIMRSQGQQTCKSATVGSTGSDAVLLIVHLDHRPKCTVKPKQIGGVRCCLGLPRVIADQLANVCEVTCCSLFRMPDSDVVMVTASPNVAAYCSHSVNEHFVYESFSRANACFSPSLASVWDHTGNVRQFAQRSVDVL